MDKKIISPFTKLLNENKEIVWCRNCTHQILNEKVISFSMQKFGLPICWNCQQKITQEKIEELKKDEIKE